MNRFMFYATLLLQSTVVLCQSMATPPGSSLDPGKLSTPQWPLAFSNGQTGQTAARPAFKSFDCHGQDTAQNQASATIDLDPLFNAPCTDLKSHVLLFARNENSLSQFSLSVAPHLKAEPIPTQWPNAKLKQIPTRWPNLALLPIDAGSPSSVSVDVVKPK